MQILKLNNGNIYKLPPKKLQRNKRSMNSFLEDTGWNI